MHFFFLSPQQTHEKIFFFKIFRNVLLQPKIKVLTVNENKIKKNYTIIKPYDVCLLKLYILKKENNIYNFFACVPCLSIFFFDNTQRKHVRWCDTEKKNKNSFYNKNSILLTEKKNICIQFFFGYDEVYSHIGNINFFLSLAPLFISDRLKKQFMVHLVCNLRTQN